MATVKGDLHDLGKNIVGTVLGSHGYRVVDLGKDVPREVILEAIRRESPQILGLSALMTSTMKEMEATVTMVREEAPEVKIMVGGASVNATFAERIGAHGYSEDAVGAVRLVEALLSGKKS
jgi:5-methyltetrahydrofolate--homocysteine methyltransferase